MALRSEHLYKRLTDKWAPGWSHLEEEEFLCTAGVEYGPRKRDPKGDYLTDDHIQRFHVYLPQGHTLDDEDIRNALYAKFSGTGCRHESDCRGCWHSSATVEKLSKHHWKVRVRSSRNY